MLLPCTFFGDPSLRAQGFLFQESKGGHVKFCPKKGPSNPPDLGMVRDAQGPPIVGEFSDKIYEISSRASARVHARSLFGA